MPRIAVIEDVQVMNDMFSGWIRTAWPDAAVDQYLNRPQAEAGLKANRYDLVCLDIELNYDTTAGIALIHLLSHHQSCPVLVVSGLSASTYRPIMKALDAWDYLVKPFEEKDMSFFLSFVSEALRKGQNVSQLSNAEKSDLKGNLRIDPLHQTSSMWKGQRINLPLTAQRIVAALTQADRVGRLVINQDLYKLIPSGHNPTNLRAHIQVIRNAFREVDPDFDCIRNVPMAGYIWQMD